MADSDDESPKNKEAESDTALADPTRTEGAAEAATPAKNADDTTDASNSTMGAAVVAVWLLLVLFLTVRFAFASFNELTGLEADAISGDTFKARLIGSWGITFSDPSKETLVILVAGSAGILGSFVYTARALAFHFSQSEFGALWIPWYFTRILVGGLLGVAVVLAVAAGLITGGTGSSDIEPSGVAVLGFITGLASKKAIDKLEELIDVIFGRPDRDADKLIDQIARVRAKEKAGDITADDATTIISSISKDS